VDKANSLTPGSIRLQSKGGLAAQRAARLFEVKPAHNMALETEARDEVETGT